MLRNDREHAAARQKLIGLSAMRRGLARMAESYQEYDIEPVASELLMQLDRETERLSNEIAWYQVERFSKDGATEQDVFSLLERIAEIPQSLQEARLALNWKQCKLAERAQMKEQQICRYERYNYSNITLVKAIALSKVLLIGYAERKVRATRSDMQEL
jgi:ribosome-binding protein aMBF1 (putative translation factor)